MNESFNRTLSDNLSIDLTINENTSDEDSITLSLPLSVF